MPGGLALAQHLHRCQLPHSLAHRHEKSAPQHHHYMIVYIVLILAWQVSDAKGLQEMSQYKGRTRRGRGSSAA